jgi:tRNA pseudouridine38-40 synthase
MGSILSKSTKTESTIGVKRPISDVEDETIMTVDTSADNNNEGLVIHETTSTTTTTTTKKRFKTSKDRKAHFEKERTWKNDVNEEEETTTRPPNTNPNKEQRHPKRKVALLLGFCGTGYQGMQL